MKSSKKTRLKQRLSIAKIGKFRFWTGIILGILSAFLFFGFIFFILEIVDVFRVIQNFDLPVKNDSQLRFEKLFLGMLSVAFGNNTMLRYWFVRPTNYFNKTYKYTSARVVNYALFIEYVVLFGAISFITRFLLYTPFIDFNIFNQYGYVLYLFPVYLFYIAWTEVSRYVKAQRWMLYTFAVSIFFVSACSFIDISDYKIGEIIYRKMHYEEITYIESEVENAKRNYNITYSEETINALKALRTESAFDLLEKTKLAFKTEEKVPLDTIILQKIALYNQKGHYIDSNNPYMYTYPFLVYKQLRKVDPKSSEAKELIDLLSIFHEIGTYLYKDHETEIQTSNPGKNALPYISHMRGMNPSYDKMYDQTSFLVYHIQKLGIYNHHPFFDTDIPFPPPSSIPDHWIQENFPEFLK